MKTQHFRSLKSMIYPRYLYIIIQMLILFTAVIIWLFNRGNSYQKHYAPAEYILNDYTIISEDITIDSKVNESGFYIRTQPQPLKKGIYQIYIDYSVSHEGSYIAANTSQLSYLEFHAPDLQLNPAYHTTIMTVELSRNVTDFSLEAFYSGNGSMTITDMFVVETSGHYKKNLFYAVLLCLLVNLIWLYTRANATGKKVIFALSGIFLAVCYPLYTDYMTVGHDIPFHLLRIEGLAEGLRNGSALPIKVHPFWAKGYGYAVGVFYGDILLYFPAVLRLLGFSVQAAYKFFVAAINLGTVIISYFSFKTMFRSTKTGVLGCLIYSFSLYRLIDIYTRASVGEYCAFMFLPLILCGFYLILMEANSKNWFRYSVLTAIGLTGLIQSHILSCEMAAIVILLSCIVLVRRVFRHYPFLALVSALGLTILLNIGFLVPFLDYYNEDLYVTSEQWTANASCTFQESGLLPVQLFSLFQHSSGGAGTTLFGVSGEMTPGMGIMFLLGILLFIYLILFHYKTCKEYRNFKPALFCLAMGVLLLFMSTCLFPWNTITSWGEVIEKSIRNLQFPWRFLAFATVLLTFAICFAVSTLQQTMNRETFISITTTFLIFSAVNCGWYFYNFSFDNVPYRVYSASELNSMSMYSYEYLPSAVDPSLIIDNVTPRENIEYIDAYQKQGTEIICHTVSAGSEGYIDFPLNYYKYYTCTNISTGERLPVSIGYNGMLRVTFPANFDGTIHIAFIEPWYWRLAEIISLLTLPAFGGAALIARRINRKIQNGQSASQAA